MIFTPSFSHFSVEFSNERFWNRSSSIDVRFVKFSVIFFVETGFKMDIEFCCYFYCSSFMLLRYNLSQYKAVFDDYCQLIFDHYSPSPVKSYYLTMFCVYCHNHGDIALEILNNWAVLVTDALAKWAPMICPL